MKVKLLPTIEQASIINANDSLNNIIDVVQVEISSYGNSPLAVTRISD